VSLALSLLLSGAAALVYQVVWIRQLTLVFGSTLGAVATVLGVFMAGLGLGGFLSARVIDKKRTSALPRIYASLELGLGVFAVSFPLLIAAASPLYRAAPSPIVRVTVAAVLLLLPTTLMGATLPTLTALQERGASKGVGRSAGVLYAANTLGAVAGSLLGALVLLPSIGMKFTTLGAAGLNALAAAVVLFGHRSTEREERRPAGVDGAPSRAATLALVVVALSGFGALVSEVAWTRSLVLLIGPTTYGFSFIVSSVILGIAAGSAIGARLARNAAPKHLGWAQAGAAMSSLLAIVVLGRLVLPMGALVHTHADDMIGLLARELLVVLALLFPASFFFGATFPLSVSLLARTPAEATGLTLAWNTGGAVLGSLAAGFLLVPTLGAERTLFLAAFVHVGAASLLLRRQAAIAVVALVVAVASPRWDREILTGGLYKYAPYMEPGEFLDFVRQGDVVYYREDDTATVSVRKVAARLSLAIDGKADATNREDMLTQRMLAHVPLLLHPDPRRVLVIGLGSGVTAGSALTHEIETLQAVEISKGVAEASELFRDVNHEPSIDPRFELVIGDGRNVLGLTGELWDVVISEPSNPWMAGVSSLFTTDFFELVRSRLAPGGLFCQWAHVYNLTEDDLKTIVASFTDVFETTALFVLSESDILLLGARDGFSPPRTASETVAADLEDVGVRGTYGVRALQAASTPELSDWARDADRHTDDRPVLEFRAARAIHEDTTRENRRALLGIGGDSLFPPIEPSADDLLARASSLERAESFEWAFETFGRAIEKDPTSLSAYEGLVRTGLASGRENAVEETLRSAGTSRVEPLLGAGHLYRSTGRLDDAVVAVGGALSLDPTRRETLLLAAEVAGDRGEIDAMASFCERALLLDPADAEAASLLAEAALRKGRFDVAARASAEILTLRPTEARALQAHAIANAELGNANLARESFEKLLELEAEDWIQRNNLARLELNRGNVERAAELFEQAVDLNPRNVVGYQGLAEAAAILEDRGRIQRSDAMLRFLGVPRSN
jgi:spermidine synthase